MSYAYTNFDAIRCSICGEAWADGHRCKPTASKPGEPSLAYLERLVLEVRDRLDALEKRLANARKGAEK